jgi:F0F1-type ATP synthase epsilon subunit
MAKLRVEVVTGEREVLVEDDVDMVIAPGSPGCSASCRATLHW